MTKIASLLTAVLCLSVCAIALDSHSAVAAPGAGEALEIAPPVVTLSADPGQTLKTQISLRDISSGEVLVTGEVNDFTASGQDGTPKVLTDSDGTNPYSLIKWVSPLPTLDLQPRQIKNLPVTISVPADAAPGGYFGVVRFTATPPELKGQGVALSASLGSLIFIKVNGQAKEQLTITKFSASTTATNSKPSSIFESTPIQFSEQIKNGGNIFEQPAGQVSIKDMFGKLIANVNVNLPPRDILPGTSRTFTEKLDSSVLGSRKLFGLYHAQLKIMYGNNQSATTNLDFWVIPYRLIGGGIIALIIAFFGLRFMLKRYNSHIIKKAQKK